MPIPSLRGRTPGIHWPMLLAFTAALIAVCGILGDALARVACLGPSTVFLAIRSGGIDSIDIIAANSKVDLPFMARQTQRFILILLAGPVLARIPAGRAKAAAGQLQGERD